ncbi:hypothetical protein LSH36_15g14052 [Paralvinella palmiformis]|uniref:Uncharacterized protein n=1 Tax=Paralvinella palmiformis TaxID=53620 RepID=A0AAD9NIR6_9ANNE|nr:hypothetical protein LSH36_15g14052 [Paralvinella palmiformis]
MCFWDTIEGILVSVPIMWVCLERVTSTNVIPQAILEKENGGSVEMKDMQEKTFGSPKDFEEYTFRWQEKVCSKRELDTYGQNYAFDTGFSREYHNNAKAAQEKGNQPRRLFSYVDNDSFTKRDSVQKVTTSSKEKPPLVADKMIKTKPTHGAGKKYSEAFV